MPDTPIDQSHSIESIRLKVPTGTVPVPPVGFGQLHSPSPGVLALRLPDGSVVEVGPAPSGGGSGVQSLDVTVTNAELKTLSSAHKVLVPAVSGAVLRFVRAFAVLDTAAGAYTAPQDAFIGYSSGGPSLTRASSVILGAGDFDGGTDSVVGIALEPHVAAGNGQGAENSLSAFVGLPLVLAAPGGDMGGGHADNTLKLRVSYEVIEDDFFV